MNHLLRSALVRFGALAFLLTGPSGAQEWKDYRGPHYNGTHPEAQVPLEWSESEGVLWKTPLPGRGWSTPVLAEGQAWMTTATEDGTRLSVLAVDVETGKRTVTRELFHVEEPQHRNKLNSFASPSPTVGHGQVYVTFGYAGTAALDPRTGETVWERRDLIVDHMEGPGSSPFVMRDLVILHFDGGDEQFVVALNAKDGSTAWKRERSLDLTDLPPDLRKAYSTPILVRRGQQSILLSSAANATYAYVPETGEELWRVPYDGFSMAPRPLHAHGLVYITTGFMESELLALRMSDDLHQPPVVEWRWSKRVPKMPSPVAYNGHLWMVSDGGIVTCLSPEGEEVWKGRMGGMTCASPIVASGHFFCFDTTGKTTVLAANEDPQKEPRVVAENQLDDGFMASPVILLDGLLLRTEGHLYRIGSGS